MSFLGRAEKLNAAFIAAVEASRAEELLEVIESISHIKDLESLLESVLREARKFVGADAGTIYLVANGRLYFSYVQNDSLQKIGKVTVFQKRRYAYGYIPGDQSLAIDRTSLAGYVASTAEPLVIDDVYDIHSGVSYTFNPDFDRKSSYTTHSILVVPLKTRDDSVLGVLQLINKKTEDDVIVPFSMRDLFYINQFAQNAAGAVEKAKLSREMVLRLIEVVELRDPYETGAHAKRVSAYAVELYEMWARKHAIPEREVAENRDPLRTGAILHDIGKVAVSDLIMKKPTELNTHERERIRLHTIFGARLFRRANSLYDRIASDIILNHHERWDGMGYPGHIENLDADPVTLGPGKKGEEIPLMARIVTIADIYDALSSKRSYKDAWPEERVTNYLRDNQGKIFDPELVEIFLDLMPVIRSIQEKYNYIRGELNDSTSGDRLGEI